MNILSKKLLTGFELLSSSIVNDNQFVNCGTTTAQRELADQAKVIV